ncbi:hypothetical protein A3K21_03565 [Candidatus Roizmanbacteria bacterium RIFOXYC1_FULL_38_14]|uniref:Uncharacterized protein n=1 Tax=Candidatus Roizmanbacteria bacterium RIFOXYD1_FULL_38_12 TaxID=1802093 RepID=A0A1F7L128_9BACT|nr:MAG: hypothetical protein A3K47_03560 [Candidatus Roizmanbacteria bacterium RIFOXYA2_FULL_38_14]OGK63839.1 MAG: hypothetical protein A3K27_03560 [Candidatus Roizmanbacteria bacterium RIFOXYA1_FULL_37_12]OGK65685.1 MAG: hypothetical protein A3K38_03560 [Candidatus Roizmanbacteria bacterium RIFOXYB1_FULL_40_23]OGK70090.1 MAG: hypothetical protein A3K21_03565 [Candidatus Roizmanbacteria bacterium RIFOXYC1_FULL_38_14]OGK73832.1 MAG: hypothetical protein A3K52_03560 [Candidatus Roizmanbacteria ba
MTLSLKKTMLPFIFRIEISLVISFGTPISFIETNASIKERTKMMKKMISIKVSQMANVKYTC